MELILCDLLGRLGHSQSIGCLLCLLVVRGVLGGLSCGGFGVAHLVHVLADGFSVHAFLYGCQVYLGTMVFSVLGLEVVLDLFGVVG